MKKIIALSLLTGLVATAAHAIKADTSTRIGEGTYVAAITGYSDNHLKFNKELVPGSGITKATLGSLDLAVAGGYMGVWKEVLLGIEVVGGYATGTKTYDDGIGKNTIDLTRGFFCEGVGKIGLRVDRAGYYVLGGFTRSNFRVQTTNKSTGKVLKAGIFHQGPFAGVGAMYNLIDRISVGAEFRHVVFNRHSLRVVLPGLSVRIRSNVYTARLIYHLQ